MNQTKTLTPHIPEEVDQELSILQFMTGLVDGEAFWAYVAMLPSKYQEYAAKVEAGESLNVSEYGEIMEKGWGTEAPIEIQQKMAEQYGADDHFEEKLRAQIQSALDEASIDQQVVSNG